MNREEYKIESEKTLSTSYFPNKEVLTDLIIEFQNAAFSLEHIDAIKKKLFYNREMTTKYTEVFDLHNNIKTLSNLDDAKINALHAGLGLLTEAYELMDMILYSLIDNKELDMVNLQEELGDINWYEAILERIYLLSHSDIMKNNIIKLRKRFPNKFTTEDANNRNTINELSHITPIK